MEVGKYDRQLIVALLDGPADEATARAAGDLNAKQRKAPLPSEVVRLVAGAAAAGHGSNSDEAALRWAMRGEGAVAMPVSARSRVYLLGRGDWQRQALSGWTAEQAAGLLARCGLDA